MRIKKSISILLTAIFILAALPVAGLAATKDFGDGEGSPLKLVASSGDCIFQTHYQEKATGQEEAFELYVEKGNITGNTITLSIDLKDAKDELKDVTHISTLTNGADYWVKGHGQRERAVHKLDNNKKASIELQFHSGFKNQTSHDYNNIEIQAWTVDPAEATGAQEENPRDFKLVLRCVAPLNVEIEEHGKVTVGQSTTGRVNPGKSARILTSASKESETFRVFDIGETVIFSIEPEEGYWPVVTGAEKYDKAKDEHKVHTELVVSNAPPKSVKYDEINTDETAWYILPTLKINGVYNVKISFVPEAIKITEIVNVDEISEFGQEGGKLKVKAKGEFISGKFHLGLFQDEELVGNLETTLDKEVTFDIPKNTTYETREYTIRASLDGMKLWSETHMDFTVLGKPKKSAAITSIKVQPETIPYHETKQNSIMVTVEGDTLKEDDEYTVAVFRGDVIVASRKVTGPNTIAFVLDRNDTDEDIEYTIRATMDNGEAYSDAEAKVLVLTKRPYITSLTASPSAFDYKGGTVTVKIEGANMENTNSDIALFEGEKQIELVIITGTSAAQLKVPENTTTASKTYTIKARESGGVWSDKTATVTVAAKPAATTGWGKDSSGKDVYYKDGAIVKNDWVSASGKWYYMDKDGHKSVGWYKDNTGKWYYSNSDGVMATGWLLDKGVWYLLADSGKMLTGWQKVGSVWYYMESSGRMKTGWLLDKGDWYLLAGSGKMLTGWQLSGGKWYYMNSSGRMLTKWFQDVNGKWYYLNHPSGDMVVGTKVIDGRRSRFNNSGTWLGYY